MKSILSTIQRQAVHAIFDTYPQIIAVYCYGSRTKGNALATSDLDIGIVCMDKDTLSPIDIEAKIARAITGYTLHIHLLDLSDNPLLLIRVINGVVIYEQNFHGRAELERQILHLYEDAQALLRIRTHYLDTSFQEGIYAH